MDIGVREAEEARLVEQGHLVHQEKMVNLVKLAHLGNQEQLDKLVMRDCLVNLAPGVFKVIQDKME